MLRCTNADRIRAAPQKCGFEILIVLLKPMAVSFPHFSCRGINPTHRAGFRVLRHDQAYIRQFRFRWVGHLNPDNIVPPLGNAQRIGIAFAHKIGQDEANAAFLDHIIKILQACRDIRAAARWRKVNHFADDAQNVVCPSWAE